MSISLSPSVTFPAQRDFFYVATTDNPIEYTRPAWNCRLFFSTPIKRVSEHFAYFCINYFQWFDSGFSLCTGPNHRLSSKIWELGKNGENYFATRNFGSKTLNSRLLRSNVENIHILEGNQTFLEKFDGKTKFWRNVWKLWQILVFVRHNKVRKFSNFIEE
jgi:hypothetical protein